ncbi:MAG: PD-(D/E)XK nuclease family transposase [Bacteroidales bacterium]|jgi:predicted transposase/invertase (TIGR01784 family)|nr:PD-(D/E)XK nuclease family transposase [Bacteroidales bacterium]
MNRSTKTGETNAGRSLIRFDWALKRLLRNKADYVVLEGFLSVLLGENVKITSIGESESNQTKAGDKFNRVDILVENGAGEIFIIELQNCRQVDYLFRMLFGVSKAITEHIKVGEDYTHVRKVYHINIVYFELGKGEDYVYHGTTSFKGIHRGDELKLTPDQQEFFAKKTISDLYPEYYILKVRDFDDHARDSLDQWIYYFKNSVIPDSFNAPGLPEARELLQVDALSPFERRAYDAHLMQLSHEYSIMQTAIDRSMKEGKEKGIKEGIKEGIKKGKEEGIKEGIKQGKEEGIKEGRAAGEEDRKKLQEALAQKDGVIANAVKSLVGQGLSLQQIAQILQLDVEEVGKNIPPPVMNDE